MTTMATITTAEFRDIINHTSRRSATVLTNWVNTTTGNTCPAFAVADLPTALTLMFTLGDLYGDHKYADGFAAPECLVRGKVIVSFPNLGFAP